MATNYIYVVQPLDKVIEEGARRLAAKKRKTAGDENKLLTDLDKEVPRTFGERDKVTVMGHGTVNGKPGQYQLGGKAPETLARTVNKYFAKIPKIVLLMCGDDSLEGPRRFAKTMFKDFAYKGVIVAYNTSMRTDETTGKRLSFIPNPFKGMEGIVLDAKGAEELVAGRSARKKADESTDFDFV